MTTDNSDETTKLVKLIGRAVADLGSQSGRITSDLTLASDLGATLEDDGIVDDRKYIYEGIIQLAASLPNDSEVREELSATFIKKLWTTLKHPPLSYVGEKFRYRTADGSYNNVMYPQLGAAGSHYARSVVGTHLRSTKLPEPGLIFDTLLKRDGLARQHPTKVSSHLFYLAAIVIHDIFRTDDVDNTVVKSSSYLDLGPLYGHDEGQQNTVRTFQDGLLKKDCFTEYRFLAQPPGACALLIAFNRFHNYVVQELATINENGRFSLPDGVTPDSPGYADAQRKRDNDLFQTGRLITCGLYVNIILGDYLRTILNLNANSVDSDWTLDPRKTFSAVFDSDGTPKGIGNQVSAEFNFVYRWHSTISDHDEAWLDGFMSQIFGAGVDFNTLSTAQFLTTLKNWFHTSIPKDPAQWTFGNLARQSDGGFDDSALVDLLKTATDTVAGTFGARNIPPALKAIEILGIQQGREWGLASFNEFRSFFGLKTFTDFTDINSDPGVAESLEALYGHPDNVELYPGLMAEEAKKPFNPGSGVCPGFTISEAILSDAVSLVRGDRFYAVEYGPQSLTSFGFQEVASDHDVAGGGMMYKLLMRAFPGWYRANSVYALYPFGTPDRSRELFPDGKEPHNIELNYDAPAPTPTPIVVTTWQGVVDLLSDQTDFKVPWGTHIYQMTKHDYMLSGDQPANSTERDQVKSAMYQPTDTLQEVRTFFEAVTEDLIGKNKLKLANDYQIDIVQDIGNLASALFTANFFGIPLSEDSNDGKSSLTAQEIYDSLAGLFEYVFLDTDLAKSYKHRVVAQDDTQKLAKVVRAAVESAHSITGQLLSEFETPKGPTMPHFGKALIKRLLQNKSTEDVVWELIPTQAGAAASLAQGWAQMIDFYMSDQYNHYWADIVKLAQSNSDADFEKLKKYVLESFRLAPSDAGALRISATATNIRDGDRSISVPAGSPVFADFITAGLDANKFPDPQTVVLTRPEADYVHYGWGPHACAGRSIVTTAVASMLGVFARVCKGVRNTPGTAGQMQKKMYNGVYPLYLSENGASWENFPVAKKVLFDV